MSAEFKMQSPWQAGQDKLEASITKLEKRVYFLEKSLLTTTSLGLISFIVMCVAFGLFLWSR